jgi:phospholipid/cholesterol/gamma-HCH transport system substrate-binding protein
MDDPARPEEPTTGTPAAANAASADAAHGTSDGISPPPPGAASVLPEPPPPVPHAELKATALLMLLFGLVLGAVIYVLYARGVFEPTQELVLVSPDSEGVVVGMDLTFSGFPIGRVRRIELSAEGNARIIIDVPKKDAHWLRTSSVFTLVRGIVGSTAIKAYSGILTDPPLPAGAVRQVLQGDATAEIPQLLAAAKEAMQNVARLTGDESALKASLDNLQGLTGRLNGPQGALGALMGGEAEAKKLMLTIERANTLLARLDGLVVRTDGLMAKADDQVFGREGVMQDTRAAAKQLNQMLGEARASLKRVDAVLADAQVVAANAKVATADLGTLRAEVEASLRKVEQLVNEVNRRWPFARDTEIKLP